MYTVVRFTSKSLTNQEFEQLGAVLNEVVPGAFTGLRHAGDGFACEVAEGDDWEVQRAAIVEFISRAVPALIEARERGVDVCVDVAIEPEDIEAVAVLSIYIDPPLAEWMTSTSVNLVLSYYGTAPTRPQNGRIATFHIP